MAIAPLAILAVYFTDPAQKTEETNKCLFFNNLNSYWQKTPFSRISVNKDIIFVILNHL